MSNTLQRLLLFFVGIPGFVALVIFFPFARHLPVVVIALIVVAVATHEMLTLLKTSGTSLKPGRMIVANLFISLSGYIACLYVDAIPGSPRPAEALFLAAGLAAVLLFAPVAFTSRDKMPQVMRTTAAMSLVLVYPGILGAFWVLIASGFEQGMAAIFSFSFMTFGNDSLAWFFGVTLGRRRGIVAASPNKSLAGFIGGLAGSVLATFISRFLFPDAIHASWIVLSLWGLTTGLCVIAGDLFESALKRSVGVKDSGTIVPGRGGLLDSFDSLLFAAPVFLLIARFAGFFNQV